MHLIHLHFDEFCILKPHSSRPANSERYIVGLGFREAKPAVLEYLYQVNDLISQKKARDGGRASG